MNSYPRVVLWTALMVYCALNRGLSAQQITPGSHPSPLFFQQGETIQLSCTFNPSTHSYVQWRHPSFGPLSVSTERFSISQPSTSTSIASTSTDFFVTPTNSADNGTYRCEFTEMATSNMDYSEIHAFFQQPIAFSSPDNERYSPSTGESITLICGAEHHREIQWFGPDGLAIDVAGSGGRFRLVGGNLIIEDVYPSDNGTYRCRASNARFSADLNAHIFVNPGLSLSITASPEQASVELASRVVFTCTARSYPRTNGSRLVWLRGDIEMTEETRMSEVRFPNEITVERDLVLDPVGLLDVGSYWCTVEGTSEPASVSLEVIGTLSPPQNIAATLAGDTAVMVTWEPPLLDDPTNEIISYKVTWVAENGTSQQTTSFFQTPSGSVRSYTISGLERGIRYSVTVHASNNTGRGRDSEPVTITTNPTVPDAPTGIEIIATNSSFVELVVMLGGGDGGASVTLVRVGYQRLRTGDEEEEEEEILDTELEREGEQNLFVRIGNLQQLSEYQFRASSMNWKGFSPYYQRSEVVLTAASPVSLQPPDAAFPLVPVVAGVFGVLVGCVIVGAVVIAVFFCTWRRRRSGKRTINYAPSTGSLPPDDLRRGSARSTKALIEFDSEQPRVVAYLNQTSVGSSTLSSQNSCEENNSPATVMSSLNSNTYPSQPLTPIPEHGSQPAHHSSTPSHHHTQYSAHQQHFEITDNPLNQLYEDEKRAEMSQSFGFRGEDTEDVILHPGGPHDSYSEDGVSTNPVYGHVPYLGESYSQSCSPSFPQMMHQNKLPPVVHNGGAYGESEVSFSLQGEEGEGGAMAGGQALEYTDNEAYETFTPPVIRRDLKARPRFEITGGGGGGGVREKVEIRL